MSQRSHCCLSFSSIKFTSSCEAEIFQWAIDKAAKVLLRISFLAFISTNRGHGFVWIEVWVIRATFGYFNSYRRVVATCWGFFFILSVYIRRWLAAYSFIFFGGALRIDLDEMISLKIANNKNYFNYNKSKAQNYDKNFHCQLKKEQLMWFEDWRLHL